MEERQRGAVDPVAAGRPAQARLRHLQAHRGPLRRGAAVPRHLALPAALPPRETRLDSRAVGGEIRTTKTALLRLDAPRAQGPGAAAAKLARFCRSGRKDY